MISKVIKRIFILTGLIFISCSTIFNDEKTTEENNESEIQLQTPTGLTKSEITSSSVKISWNKVENATNYLLITSNSNSTIKVSENYYILSNELPENTISIKVAAVSSTNIISNYCEPISVIFLSSTVDTTKYPYPKNFCIYSASGVSVSLNWSSVSSASNYYVYGSTNGEVYRLYSSYSTSGNTGVSFCGLKENTTYYFKIASLFSDKTISQYSPIVLKVTTGTNTSTTGSGTSSGGSTTTTTTTTSSSSINYTGKKCYLKIENNSRNSGHYIYKIVIEDMNNNGHNIYSNSNLKIKSSKDSVINEKSISFNTNEKYSKNKIKVTVYAKGGTKGYGHGITYINPSSTNITNTTLFWSGYTLQ